MIIDRITAIRAIPPRIVATPVPVGSRRCAVETATVVRSGERWIAEGTTGTILYVSYEEIEVDFYSPRDLILGAQQVQVHPA